MIYDVFAGIGPFALPAAKKGCLVFANDLNAESYKWLVHNSKLNKVENNFHAYNLDGREFVLTVVRDDITQRLDSNDFTGRLHIVMNLPATAIEFLDSFSGLVQKERRSKPPSKLPQVHCYCFTKDMENPEQDVRERTKTSLGWPVDETAEVHLVRNVAPNKDMYCISFLLPAGVLFEGVSNYEEPTAKRIKKS